MRIELSPRAGGVALALMLAAIVALIWLNRLQAPAREAAIRERLARSGFENVELREAWVLTCPRRTSGYRWRASNGKGRACADSWPVVTIFIDELR